MNIRRVALAFFAALAISASALASTRSWEEVDRFPAPQSVENVVGQEDISVAAHDGYVYVNVRQTSDVKVFTILGQLIVRQQLKPGVYRFRLGSRGIYLLKAGSLTRRITI